MVFPIARSEVAARPGPIRTWSGEPVARDVTCQPTNPGPAGAQPHCLLGWQCNAWGHIGVCAAGLAAALSCATYRVVAT